MDNTVTIDTFPITEDMYQIKSIDIINSNFISLRNWHNIFSQFCKMNDSTGVMLFNIENANLLQSSDIETDHIRSEKKYDPSGVITNETNRRVFDISENALMYKNFIIDDEGIHIPIESIRVIKTDADVVTVNNGLKNPGENANGLTRTIINTMQKVIRLENVNGTTLLVNNGTAVNLICYEGVWYKLN